MIYWHDKRPDTMGSGFFSELFIHMGKCGRHVDPPAHLIKGLHTVDQIDPKEMILLLVVIDVHGESAITWITHKSGGKRSPKMCSGGLTESRGTNEGSR